MDSVNVVTTCSPIYDVGRKDDGTGKPRYRMVINYQDLNAITISPKYQLPTIQELFDVLPSAKVFTTIDVEQGFHQIRTEPHAQYKTAFRTCMGQCEFKLMPFDLRGASGTLHVVLNRIFFPLIGKGVLAYLISLLVCSQDVESHAKLLDRVLKNRKDNRMYPKVSKCNFGSDAIEYLGYIVSSEGITPSREKVKAIAIWPEELQNDTQVKQFLGTFKYCRLFTGLAFAGLARFVVESIKKGVDFKWKDEHTRAVKTLKGKLADYLTLQVPDPATLYALESDASGHAVGAVLEQEGRVG